ncbi:VOC family protein [Chloroflexota bacterium]
MADKASSTRLDHVGIIVEDLEKAVDYAQSLGIGPFKALQNLVREDTQLYGKPVEPADIKLRVKMADIGGGARLELIQPLGRGPWQDFLETKGNGIHHRAFVADDVTREGAKLLEQGATVLYSVRFQGGGGSIYLETSKFGGIVNVIEFVSWPPLDVNI